MDSAEDIIKALDLAPHPEGGYYRRTFSNADGPNDRGHASCIYYLIEQRSFALWHKVDADELWCWHAGAPAVIETGRTTVAEDCFEMGSDILGGDLPQLVIPAHTWQRVKSKGDWSLFSCFVSPGFLFENLDLQMESRPTGK